MHGVFYHMDRNRGNDVDYTKIENKCGHPHERVNEWLKPFFLYLPQKLNRKFECCFDLFL